MTAPYYKKTIIIISIYAVLFGTVYFLFLRPSLLEIGKNKKSISENEKQLSSNYDEISSLQKIEKNKEEFDQIKGTVENYLPASLKSSQFIVEVEGLTRKLGITIDNFSMSETSSILGGIKKESKEDSSDDKASKSDTKKSKSKTQQNQFTLTAKTDYPKTVDFLKQMEKLSRFNSLTSLDILSVENNAVNLKITGNIFYEQ